MSILLDTNNINNIKLDSFVKKLNEFYSSKAGIRSTNVNKIQKAAVSLKKWNKSNSLNTVPNLESNGDLDEIIENLENPNYNFNTDYLNSLGDEFIKKSGLTILYDKSNNNVSNFLQFIKKASQKEVFVRLKNELSEEEFNLGFEIYNLEITIPHKLYNYFLNDPGIDDLPFEVDDELILEKKLNRYRTIKSNDEFLQQLNHIGLNSNLKFDYNSIVVKHYYLSNEIKEQSLIIKNQIMNAFNLINRKINIYFDYSLEMNKLLNKLDSIGD